MSRNKPRRLSPDEEELWSKIARGTTPMHREPSAPPLPITESPSREVRRPRPEATDLTNFELGAAAPSTAPSNDIVPDVSERLAAQSPRMDAKAFQKLKRGRMPVEGRIDLHGLTLSQAQPRLISFVLSSHAQGKRLVLVITGKGREREDDWPMPLRQGVLKHQVPQWLNAGPAAPVVLQIARAHRKHGGAGAYYVYLRRAGK